MLTIINYNIPKDIKSGIYKIVTSDGYYYIGSTNDLRKRYTAHLYKLKHRKHENPHMVSRFHSKVDVWNFDLIQEVESEQLIITEQKLLNECWGNEKCMNISKDAISFFAGRKHTEEAKKQISVKNKNRKRTLEWIQNISNINKGRKNNLNKGMVYNCFHKEYGSFTGTLPQLIRSFPDLKLKIQCLRDVSNNKTVRNNHKGWAVSKTS